VAAVEKCTVRMQPYSIEASDRWQWYSAGSPSAVLATDRAMVLVTRSHERPYVAVSRRFVLDVFKLVGAVPRRSRRERDISMRDLLS
jgi:hypothetical protein